MPDAIRMRSRASASAVERLAQVTSPNSEATTEAVCKFLKERGVSEEQYGGAEACVHCLVLLEAGFVYDELQALTPFAQLQRDFFASLSGGACNSGYLYFPHHRCPPDESVAGFAQYAWRGHVFLPVACVAHV